MRLILFDIDGTLLTCGPQVRPLFGAALVEIFGTTGPVDRHDFAGKTDPQIVLELMARTGREEAEIRAALPRVQRMFARNLASGLRREHMRLMPGVVELLGKLRTREDLHLGLLTGNWEESGRIKLARFDLNDFFAFGAFGDDAEDRLELLPVALERARQRTGERFDPEDALIVGDTPLDVACGRAHGVPTLAVSTGYTPAAKLREAGADWVVKELRELEKVVPGMREG